MSRDPIRLVIDARPRGPRGPFAAEPVRGRTMLAYLLDLAGQVAGEDVRVTIHARAEEHEAVDHWRAGDSSTRFVLAVGPPPEGAAVLRTDRLYDAPRLKRALRRGRDPETAVIWRLDRPHALEGADDELTRRLSYQPLGRYWAIEPARRIARALAPTRVRPNALTLASAALVLGASAVVASPWTGWAANALAASCLALGLVLDTSDGHLARLQGTSSAFGRWLDGWLDEVGDMALHGAIAWSAFARSGQPPWLLLGFLYASGKYVFVVGQGLSSGEKVSTEPPIEPRPGSRLPSLVRLAGHADLRWHFWIVLALVGRLDVALIAYAVYFPARAAAMAARKAVRGG